MDYVLWLCHYHSTGVSVSGCFGLFLFFFFFSYLKVNAVCRMGVLPVLITPFVPLFLFFSEISQTSS